ncbi:MAG TPA: hypothetical protein VGE41_09255 [Verrucomicrobiae bacterium]
MLFALLALALLVGLNKSAAAVSSASAARDALTNDFSGGTKSIFIDDPQVGRDPFFPDSKRRIGQAVKAGTPLNYSNLNLQGISSVRGKRYAIINTRTFEVGELGGVKAGSETIKLKCVEIKEKSAVVSIDGHLQEIFLGSRL